MFECKLLIPEFGIENLGGGTLIKKDLSDTTELLSSSDDVFSTAL